MADAAAPAPFVHWSGLTHVGRVRQNNEDAFLALAVDGREVRYLGKTGHASLGESDFVFAVSDGMGGAKSGEFASRITVDRITRLFPRAFRMAASGLGAGFNDVLAELVTAIHQDLLKLGYSYEECAGMGATLSLCWVRPDWVYFAHLGDTRIYYLPLGGDLTQVTHDHSHVGWLRRAKQINEREARTHPRRNSLNQALGAGHQFIEPHIGAVAHRPGDRFVIGSDGLIDGLWDRQIEEQLRVPEPRPDGVSPAHALVHQAVENSGRDNVTALVFDLVAGP
ncbi:MAG: protein phosphatase [Opitutia bacterium Tous-C1TDCM]|nr:MAG: protein phosphatase [Opitutae bacterium Tous-C1TDCM]